MEFKFSVGAKIKEAWNIYKENLGNIILFLGASIVFQIIINSLFPNSTNATNLAEFIRFIPVLIISVLVSLVSNSLIGYIWIRSSLDAIDGKGFHPFSKETLSFHSFWNYLKTNILFGLIIFIPSLVIGIILAISYFFISKAVFIFILILFIVLSVFVMTRLMPSMYLAVDKNQGARKSIEEAWYLTKNCVGTIFGSLFLVFLFMLLGVLALVVGLIVTYPVSLIMIVMLYRELVKFRYGSDQASGIPFVNDIPEVLVKPEVISETKVEEVK